MMTAPLHDLIRGTIARLIDVCTFSQGLYRRASMEVADPILRAELMQYSTQRREFIVELQALASGEEQAMTVEPQLNVERPVNPIEQSNTSQLLNECERNEAGVLDVYREAIAADLPYAIGGAVHSQFLAISRVQSRIHTLGEKANDAR